jgi:hypothetical protein
LTRPEKRSILFRNNKGKKPLLVFIFLNFLPEIKATKAALVNRRLCGFFCGSAHMILSPFLREGVMPLPVTFISTISRDGIRNIAPWSCVMPVLRPLDLICAASAKKRDTLVNIRETGQFVLNLPGTDLAEKVMPTARYSSPEVDEFVEAGLPPRPSTLVKPPGIAGCYGWGKLGTSIDILIAIHVVTC